MTLAQQIAKHFRDVHFGGNWTCVNLKNTLENVTWQQATQKTEDLNTIAALVYHVNYYVSAVLKVLQGGALEAHDKFSFDVPEITSGEQWQQLVTKVLTEAEQFANEIEKLDDSVFFQDFTDAKYGSYFRNLHGIIEHTHYHLGQVTILKKLVVNK
ncbi:DUF1572 domain-containing protein [Flavobacterium beibuense]|uniref:DinB_2 domain containing protein n=1 Tax=Flavobacterium beibuense TaxID=657326 RepID=A0A444WFC3_9FLAO|nr:DUF1572 domain-containing protein [Flavobacterium beibuense]RYJ44550.1 DinB_2 domain containing protein [Flavobacterium beibuense]